MGGAWAAAALVLAGSLAGALPARAEAEQAVVQPQTGLDVVPLIISRSATQVAELRVEVARTVAQQQHGMKGRLHVPPGTGMLFPRNPPQRVAFWMRDTPSPLDMIFVSPNGRIESIAERVRPMSDERTYSRGPVIAVLEIGAGEARRLGLRVGDRVSWGQP